jgi:putative transposase
MPRLPRNIVAGQPHHVIQRGNNRQPMFLSNSDYLYFRKALRQSCERYGCRIHAYVFMTNHVHFIMTPAIDDAIAMTMQAVGRCYVRYFNTKYGRSGTLWEGRYRAALITSETWLLTCYRYIELNPVRAMMAASPMEYRWSSYHANAFGNCDALVSPHELYISLDSHPTRRLMAYRALFDRHLCAETLDELRQATHRGRPLGSE